MNDGLKKARELKRLQAQQDHQLEAHPGSRHVSELKELLRYAQQYSRNIIGPAQSEIDEQLIKALKDWQTATMER